MMTSFLSAKQEDTRRKIRKIHIYDELRLKALADTL